MLDRAPDRGGFRSKPASPLFGGFVHGDLLQCPRHTVVAQDTDLDLHDVPVDEELREPAEDPDIRRGTTGR